MKNENLLPANHTLRLGLCTKNPGLREVDLDPSPKTGSGKINMHKQGRNNQKKQLVSNSLDPNMDPST